MAESVAVPHLRCRRCAHRWVPRTTRVSICPRCKSHLWNSPVRPSPPTGVSRQRWQPTPADLRWLRRHRHQVLRIAAAHGASNVRVFGSVARGEASASSDVDLLVEMGPQHSLLDRAGLKVDLEHALGRRVDVVTERSLYAPLRERVLREAVRL